jgi:hypothetical protein
MPRIHFLLDHNEEATMSKTTEYLCPGKIVRRIEETKLSLHGLRVLHALLYYADKEPQGIAAGAFGSASSPIVVYSGLIPRLVGPQGSNDLLSTNRGIAELSQTDLFETLVHDTTTNHIEYKFASHIARLALRSKKDPFAMIDLLDVQKCRTAHQLSFYTAMMVAVNCDRPKFQLPGVGVGQDTWAGGVSQKWLRAAETWRQRKGLGFLVVPMTEKRSKRIESVWVKISHVDTKWSPGCFYLLTYKLLPTSVIAGVSQRLTRAKLTQRHQWRFADRS